MMNQLFVYSIFFKKFLGPDGRLGPSSAQASEENAQIFVMNNYFGIGKRMKPKKYRTGSC